MIKIREIRWENLFSIERGHYLIRNLDYILYYKIYQIIIVESKFNVRLKFTNCFVVCLMCKRNQLVKKVLRITYIKDVFHLFLFSLEIIFLFSKNYNWMYKVKSYSRHWQDIITIVLIIYCKMNSVHLSNFFPNIMIYIIVNVTKKINSMHHLIIQFLLH